MLLKKFLAIFGILILTLMPEVRWGSLQKSDDDNETIEQAILRLIAGSGVFGANSAWGNLPKSQTDDQTIEEAIDAKIVVHEADPNSHMGPGEAIENHRQSEVVDHLARSIYTDKFAYDRISEDNALGAAGAWTGTAAWQTSSFSGAQIIEGEDYTGNQYGYINFDPGFDSPTSLDIQEYFRAVVKLDIGGTSLVRFGNTDPAGSQGAYFKYQSGHLYAGYRDNSEVNQDVEVGGINVAVNNQYIIEYTTDGKINWYINGTLVRTVTYTQTDPSYVLACFAVYPQTGTYNAITILRLILEYNTAMS